MIDYRDDYSDGYADGYANGYDEGYKDAVEKAVEWLYQRQAVDLEVSDIEKFVNEFKKYMKGDKE